MDRKTLTVVTPAHFTIDDLYTLVAKAIDDATSIKSVLGALLIAVLEAMTSFNTSLGANRNRVAKSTKTAKVQAADKQRDKWDSELNRLVASASKSNLKAQLEAGTELKNFLTPYWDVARQSLPTETRSLNEMLKKYKDSETLQAYATTIGVADIFTQLEAANLETETLYNSRSDDHSANTGPSATSYKDDVVLTYTDFCELVEKAVTYTPSDDLTTLFNKLNEQRNKFAVIYNAEDKDDDNTDSGTSSGTT